MTEWEIRYRGELLGHHPSRDAAEAHAREHHGYGRVGPRHQMGVWVAPQHHIEDIENLTLAPRRPVDLLCRGNLVDTYFTVEGAKKAIAEKVTKWTPENVWLIMTFDNISISCQEEP